MTKDHKPIERAFGLDMPFEQALERFAKVTKEELQENGAASLSVIPEGETQCVMFKGAEIRKIFHANEWYFSVVDVVAALTDSTNPRRYWSDLKRQMSEKEGAFQLYEEIVQLKMPAPDGKDRETDAVNTESLFRVIQSIPSPKAEPFKRWLAKVAYERIQEIQNPEIAIKRAILTYQLQGRTDDWIEKRIRSIVTRKELTSEWRKRGVEQGKEYAVLTNVISMYTFSIDNKGHKNFKGLKPAQNLRDHMTDLELIFTMLGEKSTTEIARVRDSQGFDENLKAAQAGGAVAGTARKQLEKEIGERVVSKQNFIGADRRIADPELLSGAKKSSKPKKAG